MLQSEGRHKLFQLNKLLAGDKGEVTGDKEQNFVDLGSHDLSGNSRFILIKYGIVQIFMSSLCITAEELKIP